MLLEKEITTKILHDVMSAIKTRVCRRKNKQGGEREEGTE